MREKPLYGVPCNRCGLCCLLSPCRAAIALFNLPQGERCRFVASDSLGGFVCGLADHPIFNPIERAAITVAIGAGVGCDARATPADEDVRPSRIPGMIAAARASDAAAPPEVRAQLRRWGLYPPIEAAINPNTGAHDG